MGNLNNRSIYELAQIARLPRHLQQYIVEQHYERYTPIDHAVVALHHAAGASTSTASTRTRRTWTGLREPVSASSGSRASRR